MTPEIVELLVRKDERIAKLEEQNESLIEQISDNTIPHKDFDKIFTLCKNAIDNHDYPTRHTD